MQIREATELDIPEILKVLKASLGETSSKKTEAVWRYKHLNNPFGKSLVLVAEENNKLIGVRAFMRWEWQLSDRVFSAFRAVDTATHPDHQGKGIFKKLTLTALDLAKEQGNDFIFNTPNTQSKPGYLKMGWQEVDNIRVKFIFVNPLYWKKDDKAIYQVENSIENSNSLRKIITRRNSLFKTHGKLFTPVSLEFLNWRYEKNPLQQYAVMATDRFYVAAYVKQHKFLKELRVVEKIVGDELGKRCLICKYRNGVNCMEHML